MLRQRVLTIQSLSYHQNTSIYAMASSAVPAAVLSAAKSGDLAQLQDLYQLGMSLEEIAKQAAKYKQPHVLEWYYGQGWIRRAEPFNNDFFIWAAAIFQVLVGHGWDLNAHYTETCGDALACAIEGGEYEFVKWLLEHGHDSTPSESLHGAYAIIATVCGETASIEML
jgi:hypothetical protein